MRISGSNGFTTVLASTAAAPPAFSPGTKAGALRWFRSSDGLAFNVSNNISQWSDKSANGLNVTPPSTNPVRTASGLNGKDVATFASGTLLTGTAPALSISAPFTIFLLARNTGTNYPTAFGIPMETQSFAFQRSAGGTASYIGNGLFCYNAPLAATSAWGWYLMSYNGSGFTTLANHTFYTNGSLQTITTIANGSPGNSFSVGDYLTTSSGYGWVGDIAELAIYNTAIGGTDIADFTKYINAQYGL